MPGAISSGQARISTPIVHADQSTPAQVRVRASAGTRIVSGGGRRPSVRQAGPNVHRIRRKISPHTPSRWNEASLRAELPAPTPHFRDLRPVERTTAARAFCHAKGPGHVVAVPRGTNENQLNDEPGSWYTTYRRGKISGVVRIDGVRRHRTHDPQRTRGIPHPGTPRPPVPTVRGPPTVARGER